MLTGLRLENIALIDALDLSFRPGFTVLTGETGAGKSLLLDALDALLGGAQGGEGLRLLRPGCERASIEAGFSFSEPVRSWLIQQELEPLDSDLIISREWRQQEDRISSRGRINGVIVNRAQLLELRPLLLELTVQGQTQQLGRPGQQRRWLDRFGGEPIAEALLAARTAVRAWKDAAAALDIARAEQERQQFDRQRQLQLLEDLEAAQLDDPQERQHLQGEQDRLAHAVRLQEGVTTVSGRLVEGLEGAPSVLDHLAAIEQELQHLEGFDAGLQPWLERCAEAVLLLQELASGLDRYGAGLESDPETLSGLQERMAQLRALERRHGQDLGALIALRDDLRRQFDATGVEASLRQLEQREESSRFRRDQACARLSQRRRVAATALERHLMDTLRPLGLAHVRFSVSIEPAPPGDEGADAIGFLFSANPGQPLAPLQEVASGGEMSRFLLALKTCLAAADPHVTLLFDEIDSGVSGRVSGAIAALLRRLAEHRQVFCVTHQPLVAAMAQHHFRVSKQVEAGRTRTGVTALQDSGERERELAELAGGDSGETRSYVASLLQQGAS
ncbi:DNA repair protein RecN [Synechococcus sp. BA-124 BA4]|uniref:DNA repair protein RecN n=1 Tax=unclassified Synechococcus TaxID=2626047 RepID=UPI002AD57DF8|nr:MULTISPECIES: DNA repair protein RecN [unclassified Synechococcus]MEA5399037.1 DNA repair protein RecN [Synechococcus sp. BA-124 BA4]CAK6687689.1 DNA repair protein RecN [Synechococcus sp. CBW1107]